MSNNYGSGVARVLDPTATQFTNVIWQQGKPPTDFELNLLQDLAQDFCRKIVLRGTPSGWFGNETNTQEDFITNPLWSNWIRFGRQRTGEQSAIQWAVVNGWLIPVTGTRTGTPPGNPDDADTWNVLAFDPPPSNSGDFRIDFAFLEVWLARIPSNPSTLNKPAANAIYKYGNVEGGYSFLPDDLIDPNLGFETTQRVQVQYRIRVAKGVLGLTSYPDGFDPVAVKAQGGAATPTSFVFTNMRQTLGDPGLWRAGDGVSSNALGTVDGYVYAIPITSIFRRNSVAWNGDPSQNLNGAFNRNPTAVDRTGITTFATTVTLANDLSPSATSIQLTPVTNLPMPATPALPVLIQIGDELLTYSTISGGPTLNGLTRGVNGSRAELHRAGSVVTVLSGRPDGLFSDQIALTDVYDLRHLVNPNGFDYDALLKSSFDKLLRGQLRANWKRSGAGPQGTFVLYQDKIVNGSSALGVTKLDGPDNIRLVFSDAAVVQPIELVVQANANALPSPINVPWSLTLNANQTVRATNNTFSPNDVIVIPVAQLKAGLPGGDADQVRWVNDGVPNAVVIHVDGQVNPLDSQFYTVTPTNPGPNDDLTITFGLVPPTTSQLYITLQVMYGPGRGISRRPDALHSVAFLNPSTELLLQTSSVPLSNQALRTAWFPLWSKFRGSVYHGLVPVTSESVADLGSKTVALTPFRRIEWPTAIRTKDGTVANPYSTSLFTSNTGIGIGTTTFQDPFADFTTVIGLSVGDAIIITLGPSTHLVYRIVQIAPGGDVTKLILDQAIPNFGGATYRLAKSQGVMPLLKPDGVTAKWTTTDPLQLFSGTTEAQASTKNIYVTLPRHMVPGWGAFFVPILWQDNATFAEGVNLMLLSKKGGSPFADADKNYCPYSNGPLTYSVFSTLNFNPPGTNAATFNAAFSFGGKTFAGIRFFTDARGLGRQGLEMPPFYGVARLFAVYEANDYKVNGSAYDATTRNLTGSGATNLLRQNFPGPTFWVEIDDDGDSTFILNADAIDITRSPNPILTFASGNYVIESNIFGFDRGSFDITRDFRLVLTRPTSPSLMRSQAADGVTRANNIGVVIAGPVGVLPGPATNSDSIVLNYSRAVYQGDAWGSQTNYTDIGYAPGPLQSGSAFQIASTNLNAQALTRPNQKMVEVLASLGFTTTLGTGRISGDYSRTPPNMLDVGFEDETNYPPPSPIAPRPRVLGDVFQGEPRIIEIGTDYLGCTERLPLGALFRDKDFRGGTFGYPTTMPLILLPGVGLGAVGSLGNARKLEQTEVSVSTASLASGIPGDVIVHVDGEQGNYALLVNFRTFRGGSLFCASGYHPGGEVAAVHPDVSVFAQNNILTGRAFLVRNSVTSVGATEVSAGDELMLVVVTTVLPATNTPSPAEVLIGTNGSGEGYSAADIYRIDGHPLTRNNGRFSIDPSTIPLTFPLS